MPPGAGTRSAQNLVARNVHTDEVEAISQQLWTQKIGTDAVRPARIDIDGLRGAEGRAEWAPPRDPGPSKEVRANADRARTCEPTRWARPEKRKRFSPGVRFRQLLLRHGVTVFGDGTDDGVHISRLAAGARRRLSHESAWPAA